MSLIISNPRAVNSQQSYKNITTENEPAFSKASNTIKRVTADEKFLFYGNWWSSKLRMTKNGSIIVACSADTFKEKNNFFRK
jgi:hypothetical protein